MAKKGRMSEVEITYIKVKSNEMSVEDIASNLDRPVKTVQKYLEESKAVNQEAIVEQPVDVPPEPLRPQFINRSEGNRDGITILTQQASEMGDIKSGRKKPEKDYIHKCRNK